MRYRGRVRHGVAGTNWPAAASAALAGTEPSRVYSTPPLESRSTVPSAVGSSCALWPLIEIGRQVQALGAALLMDPEDDWLEAVCSITAIPPSPWP